VFKGELNGGDDSGTPIAKWIGDMKKILALVLCSSIAPAAWAVTYNDTITAIYGTGNPDTGWTSETANGITLALRGKNRDTGATPNSLGVYTFATGLNIAGTRARWNYEFSIDSGASFLSAYDYYLSVDLDPSMGISFTTINPFAAFNDNSFGDSSTANGAGYEGPGATNALLAGSNMIAQNSQNIIFIGLDPFQNATYNYELYAVASGAGAAGTRLTSVSASVVVGTGGAPVPDSASTSVLIGLGLVGLIGVSLRRRSIRA
jgi:hypothetical protein